MVLFENSIVCIRKLDGKVSYEQHINHFFDEPIVFFDK